MPGLLDTAKDYCLRHMEGMNHSVLADIHGGIGSLYSMTNDFQGTYEHFKSEWEHRQAAFASNQLQRPNILEVFGLGRYGNGLMALGRHEEAEQYYRRCFETWEGLPGDRLLWKANFAFCLWLLGKLDEGHGLLAPALQDRWDTSSMRFVHSLYAEQSLTLHIGQEKPYLRWETLKYPRLKSYWQPER